jgi:hypothetical protein
MQNVECTSNEVEKCSRAEDSDTENNRIESTQGSLYIFSFPFHPLSNVTKHSLRSDT